MAFDAVKKRPVYVVGKPYGEDKNGEPYLVILEIKQTRFGAEELQRKTPGSVIQKRFLSPR